MKIELKDGLQFEINDTAVNDWRLVEMFNEIDENPFVVAKIAKFILTEDSYDKLLEINKDEKGHIDAGKVEAMLTDISCHLTQQKNSNPLPNNK